MKESLMDTIADPDNKYFIFLFFVAINAMTYSIGNHHAAFASTSIICIILIYFDRKTRLILDSTFDRELKLIKTLERVDLAISKMPVSEQANFRKILKSL